MVAALFVPALGLEESRAEAEQLLRLAAAARGQTLDDSGVRIAPAARDSAAAAGAAAGNSLEQAIHWFIQVDPEAALKLAETLGPMWASRGQFSQARAWLRQMLAHSTSPSVSRGAALVNAADFARSQGDVAEALQLAREAEAVFRQIGDLRGAGRAIHQQGWCLYDQNDRAAADRCFEDGLAHARSIADDGLIADMLASLAHMRQYGAHDERDAQPVFAMLDQAAAIYERQGNREGSAVVANQMGLLHMRLDCVELAIADFSRAFEAYRAAGHDIGAAWSAEALGEMHQARGDLAGARGFARQALSIFEKAGAREGVCVCLRLLAQLALIGGDLAGAGRQYARCLHLSREIQHPFMLARAIAGLGAVALARGEPELGAALLAAADGMTGRLPPFLGPRDLADLAAWVERARGALGPRFDFAWERGKDLPDEQAIALAQLAARPRRRAPPVA